MQRVARGIIEGIEKLLHLGADFLLQQGIRRFKLYGSVTDAALQLRVQPGQIILGADAFVAMELVEGGTLRKWFAEAKHGWRKIVSTLRQAGAGLLAAHEAGLVHGERHQIKVLARGEFGVRLTVRAHKFSGKAAEKIAAAGGAAEVLA